MVLQRVQTVCLSALLVMGMSFLSGCGSTSLFKNLSGGGVQQSGAAGASQALDDGNYSVAIEKADEVITAPDASTADKQDAYMTKGQALMGQSGVTSVELAARFQEVTEGGSTTNVLTVVPEIEVSVATASAEAINTAFELTNTAMPDPDFGAVATPNTLTAESISLASSGTQNVVTLNKDQYMARLVANLMVMVKMLTIVYDIAGDGSIELNTTYVETIQQSLDYLYPPDGRGLLYYGSVVDVTYPNCGLSTDNQSKISKAVKAVKNVSLINTARQLGNASTYVGADGRRIDGNSSSSDIKAAVEYELKRVN